MWPRKWIAGTQWILTSRLTHIFKVAYGELLTIPSQTLTYNYKNPKPSSSTRSFHDSPLLYFIEEVRIKTPTW